MTIKITMKNVKDRLKDETLDLSLCDLKEVPVREIASVRKATYLDLSNNLLVTLPDTFVTLKHIVKLDLSRNMLTEIPENIGEMKQLKHLDLYANQISRLPLSLGELKHLRWLDLKENPLTPAVATVAGPCSNLSECQACARNIVTYLSNVKLTIEEERLRRQSIRAEANKEIAPVKKETKKKKKKSTEKEKKDNNEIHRLQTKVELNNENMSKDIPNSTYLRNQKTKNWWFTKLLKFLVWIFVWTFMLSFLFSLAIVIIPYYFKEQSTELFTYVQVHTGLSLKNYHEICASTTERLFQFTKLWTKHIADTITNIYNEYSRRYTSKTDL